MEKKTAIALSYYII